MAVARRGNSFATLVADFAPEQADSDILRGVYDSFRRAAASHQGIEGFVVRANDALVTVYDAHLVSEYNDFYDLDVRELVTEAAAACGRRMPRPDEGAVPVKLKTVRDVVAYLGVARESLSLPGSPIRESARIKWKFVACATIRPTGT